MSQRFSRTGSAAWLHGCIVAVPLVFLSALPARPAKLDAKRVPPPATRSVDFASDIQPLLAKHCYACHGPDQHENDLRWDVKASAFKGGVSGAAIVPGNSAESRMIRLVSGLEKDLVMPQKGDRLTAGQIGLLRAWIDQGANWPDYLANAKTPDKSDWWSFKAAIRPSVPVPAKRATNILNPIDRFIFVKLEPEGLQPSPEADRVTLIRRLTYDLTGLPPTPKEVEEFVSDESRNSYEKLVDRLLASPRYGERWGRHWLDVVHYGESHGYDKDKIRRNVWPYRDYVIRSLNGDKPYGRFIEEQLAGDVLFPEDPEGIVATGFIAAGPWDFVGHVELPITKTDGLIARYNDRDDMVMTAMSTFQSLTVHCARCHDHKFDPITQQDYYSLQAIFAGVDRANRPYDSDKKIHEQRRAITAAMRRLEDRQKALAAVVARISAPEIQRLDVKMKEAKAQLDALPKNNPEPSPGNGYHSGIEPQPEVEKWVQVDLNDSPTIDEIRLIPARPTDFPDTPGFGFPKRFRIDASADAGFRERTVLADHTAADVPNPGDKPFAVAGRGLRARFVRVTATRLWERTHDYVFALAELQVFSSGTNVGRAAPVSALDSIEAGRWGKARLVDGYDSRRFIDNTAQTTEVDARRNSLWAELESLEQGRARQVDALTSAATKTEINKITARLSELKRELQSLPPPQVVYAAAHDFATEGSFVSAKEPRPVYLLQRGDVKRPGQLMVPAAPAAVPGPNSKFNLPDLNDEGARRAALAKWLTHPKNMLTRRSIVNRVWQYHFGRGLVDTPNDFGHMGAQPTHPELLDWLAFWFLDNGESLKKLHHLIVTSATYRQSSRSQPEFTQIDGDNRYLWRMNRARLDAEEIHDAMLAVSGKLDLTMGGASVQQFFFKDDHSPTYDYTRYDVDSPGGSRRSVYRHIVRSVTDPFMDCLDAADPSLLTPRRNTTLTALQALATLNNPFVLRQCEYFAERLSRMSHDVNSQITAAYVLALSRPPTTAEREQLSAYAQKHGLANACRLIFNDTEFVFVD